MNAVNSPIASSTSRTSAPDMLHNMARGAHHTIDRLTEQATPHAQHLQDSLSSAGEMLDERADQLRTLGDEWVESLRSGVRENPLVAIGAALAVGVLIARLSR